MSTTTSPDDGRSDAREQDVVPPVLEWLVAALLAMVALAMALGGSALLWASDADVIDTAIADAAAAGTLHVDPLTPAEVTEIATNIAVWLGVGLIVTGLGMVAVAILYALARRRAHQSASHDPRRELLSNALVGAVTTAVLSFVPVSPILGGGVAGYLQRKTETNPTTAGALAGLISAIPLVALLLFLTVGLVTGLSSAGIGLGVVAALGMATAILTSLVYFVGLGALGGYFAGVLTDDGSDPEEGLDTSRDTNSSP